MGYLDDAQQATKGLDELLADFGIYDTDNEQAVTNQLLAMLLAEQTGQSAQSYYQDGYEPLAPGETDDGRSTASYTNIEGITASTDKKEGNLGLVCDTIAIRDLTDELLVAFKDPDEHEDAWITVEAADSPFVLSGVYGIATNRIWYKRGPNASADHDFNVLAVKRRGR